MKNKTLSCISLLLLFSLAACGGSTINGSANNDGNDDNDSGGNNDAGNNQTSANGNADFSYITYEEDGREWIDNGPAKAVETFEPEVLSPISTVQVFCPTTYSYVYAWTGAGNTSSEKFLGTWPGTKLNDYNSRWKTFSFPADKLSFKLIFNTPGQTADLSLDGAGHYGLVNGALTKSDTEP